MRIWVDTKTGTWGSNPEALRMVEATDDELEYLERASDSQICEFGLERGRA